MLKGSWHLSMELSCLADAFNIRKRKQFRKKDADLASSSLWGRKEEGEMVKGFVFSSDGERTEEGALAGA